MAYTNAQATPRGDIASFVSEANADFSKLLIGDLVLPPKPEAVRSGIYMKQTLANGELLNADAKARAQGAGYSRVNRKYESDTFDTVEYGLESVIDDRYAADVSRFFALETNEAKLLDRSLRLSYEARVATAVMNSTTFTATNSGTAYTVANLATFNVAGDVDEAKTRLLKKGIIPNAIIMGVEVFNRIRRSALLQNQIYGVVPRTAGQNMLPSEEDVARALGVEKLFVGKAAKNANQKGQSYSGSFIWGTTYIMVCAVESGDYEAGGIGRTIWYDKDTTGLVTPETYRDDARRSDILRVRQDVVEKIVDSTAGELITTQYS